MKLCSDPMWNNVFQIPYFRIMNLVLTTTLIDLMVVHMGKSHVFVIMTMNNGNHCGPLTVAPLCKGHVYCQFVYSFTWLG